MAEHASERVVKDDRRGKSGRGLREPVNGLTHIFGAVAALVVTVPLVVQTQGGWIDHLATAVFGFTSVVLFVASSLLHSLWVGERHAVWLRRFDHAAIFLLIAGTYTPILLVALRPQSPRLAWALLVIVWLMAAAGLIFKLVWIEAPRWLSTGIYLAMGWLVVGAIVPVVRALGWTGTTWLALGGLCYTVGAVIYGLKRPNPWRSFGFHEIWHVLVLLGWACHTVMIFAVT